MLLGKIENSLTNMAVKGVTGKVHLELVLKCNELIMLSVPYLLVREMSLGFSAPTTLTMSLGFPA